MLVKLTMELQSSHLIKIPLKQRHFSNVNIAKFVEKLHYLEPRKIFQCSDENFAYDQFIKLFNNKFNENYPLRSPQSRNKQKPNGMMRY